MLSYRYDELEYAKVIYKDGFQSTFLKYELVVLVKYLKHIKYSKKDTEVFLYDFCRKNIEGFNEVKYYKTIDGAIRDGRKKNNPLIIIKKIPVYIEELEYIDSFEIGNEYKKLLLAFYIKKKISLEIHKLINKEAKISLYFEGSKKKFKEIFDCANIGNGFKIDFMINNLVTSKIISSGYNGDIVLDFVNGIKFDEGCEKIFYVIEPCDFGNIGLVFDCYKSMNKVTKCQLCGKIIKSKGKKNNKYCEKCAKEKIKERDRERKKKKLR